MTGEWTNITFTKSGYNSVELGITNDEVAYTRQITQITYPQSSARWISGEANNNLTKILDLLQVEKRLNFDGVIYTDSTNDASTKKDYLELLNLAGGVISFDYNGESTSGIIEKLLIIKHVSEGTEPGTEQVGYTFKMTILIGVDLLGGV